ncbi:MAG: lipase maturation factor family protein [Verrucomicrobiota bacterium]
MKEANEGVRAGRWERVQRLLNGGEPGTSQYGMARWLFVRGLGLIYLMAIVSWWTQVDGLVGERGIQPAGAFLDTVAQHFGSKGAGFLEYAPTVLWWADDVDAWLHGLCAVGVVLACFVMAGVMAGPSLLGLWVVYLSLVTTGGAFMSFQWDMLLLETGFLALFLAPWRWYFSREDRDASRLMVFLFHWLLFRLMFFAGYVKLASGDPSWWEGTALFVHYETQPIPNWVSWYVHQLPVWFHKLSCWMMFVIELVFPFFIFLGRRARLVAFFGFVGLMGLIVVTGNYTYFNYLTILLCVLLLDDALWPRKWRGLEREERVTGERGRVAGRRGRAGSPASVESEERAAKRRTPVEWGVGTARVLAACVVLPLSVMTAIDQFNRWKGGKRVAFTWPAEVQEARGLFSPFRVVGGYGLFADMTETRPEIEIEGSEDGVTWKPYRFGWKSDELDRRPRFVAPHQPRLDWQMWFEALTAERVGGAIDPRRQGGWFVPFLLRLLEGSEPVMGLLRENPFPEGPPRYVRARVYRYEFSEPEAKRDAGEWWDREYLFEYVPSISVRRG